MIHADINGVPDGWGRIGEDDIIKRGDWLIASAFWSDWRHGSNANASIGYTINNYVGFNTNRKVVAFRKGHAPRKLPMNKHFSSPLPLP